MRSASLAHRKLRLHCGSAFSCACAQEAAPPLRQCVQLRLRTGSFASTAAVRSASLAHRKLRLHCGSALSFACVQEASPPLRQCVQLRLRTGSCASTAAALGCAQAQDSSSFLLKKFEPPGAIRTALFAVEDWKGQGNSLERRQPRTASSHPGVCASGAAHYFRMLRIPQTATPLSVSPVKNTVWHFRSWSQP